MAKKIYIHLILLLAMALALRLGITHRQVRPLSNYTVERLPTHLASQPGIDLPLTPFEVDLLAPDGGRIIQRRYGDGVTALWLAAVQSSSDWRVQHPPQICYVAQGWRIDEQTGITLRDRNGRAHDVRRMIVRKTNDPRVVYYLYTDGQHWTASYANRVMHAFLDRAIRSQSTTWVLVQVSTPYYSVSDEARVASACLELFDQATK
ncbi:MAG: exosortase-associated EpsI family protein [bacterium]